MFTCLPFGLNVAGLVFSKVCCTLIKKWRSEGKLTVLYLDDGLLLADMLEQALSDVIDVRLDLAEAGFVINEKKSCWLPCQSLKWLGFIFNSGHAVRQIEYVISVIAQALKSRPLDFTGFQIRGENEIYI